MRFLLVMMAAALLLGGCAPAEQDTAGLNPTRTLGPANTPQVTATPAWQPPLPKIDPVLVPPEQRAIVDYRLSGMMEHFELLIQADGAATVRGSFEGEEYIAAGQLSDQQLAELHALFTAADFFNLDADYTKDPKNPEATTVVDLDSTTITYQPGGAGTRSHTIVTWGYAFNPQSLTNVMVALRGLAEHLRDTNREPVRELISYGFDLSNGLYGRMRIDDKGRTYYYEYLGSSGYEAAGGVLDPRQLEELRALVAQLDTRTLPDTYNGEGKGDWLSRPDPLLTLVLSWRSPSEKSIGFYPGAPVPPEVQALLERLAELYVELHPPP